MTELVRPDAARHREWLELAAEFGGAHIDGASIADDRVATLADPVAFLAWIDELADQERGRNLGAGRVPCTSRWIQQDRHLVGTISLRHRLDDRLLHDGGHIGYAVRPTARRRGIAGQALRLMLEQARVLGIDPVLVCCAQSNVASRRIIEAAGGSYEDSRDGTRRYWIGLSGLAPSGT